jgi:hypothetical protein
MRHLRLIPVFNVLRFHHLKQRVTERELVLSLIEAEAHFVKD